MMYPTVLRHRAPDIWSDFNQFFGRRLSEDITSAWSPAVDVRETNDELIMLVELPGLDTKEVSVSVEKNVLTISGEKKKMFEEGDDDSKYHVVERYYGRFERSFRPQTVSADKVDARLKDGVLAISLPKVEAAKPRKIEVKVK
ncbi:MAG: Hsp20/alpha crystallin family protein [Gemmatimonadales bacterium]